MLICPTLGSIRAAFVGIFDGTAGPEASEFIQQNILTHLLQSEMFKKSSEWLNDDVLDQEALSAIADQLSECIRSVFLSVDLALIDLCKARKLHYVSSTAVTVLLWRNVLTVAHVGDSRACIAKLSGGMLRPEWLTVDHKPNTPSELQRIESCGGSLVWLHGIKPYIRGGDFVARQAMGERPKQLNYSRAFGGKDLKKYGLIAEPDVSHFLITAEDRLVVLGSDGLWDVLSPSAVCNIAIQTHLNGGSAADEIVRIALQEMPKCGVVDNISAIVIFLNESIL